MATRKVVMLSTLDNLITRDEWMVVDDGESVAE